MKRFDLELAVGVFVLAGIACLGYLSIRIGRAEVLGSRGYEVYATFSNTGGLKVGSQVVIAGVKVGRVKHIALEDYEAKVTLDLTKDIEIQTDAIASIRTRGLIGEKYVEITPGGEEEVVAPGERIRDTEPAIDIESLIANYVFGKL